MLIFKKGIIVIVGPTAVGKSDFAVELAMRCAGEIVNGDLGQFYTQLTIGTAKPELDKQPVPHHLFNILDKPGTYTVKHYRHDVMRLIDHLWQQRKIPIIVGGSTFYISSLYFPPKELPEKELSPQQREHIARATWQDLLRIDPERAAELGKHDAYRIARALTIWYQTGKKPSLFKPVFHPVSSSLFIVLSRNREELYTRINSRVIHMFQEGWLDEGRMLLDTPWEPFIRQKGFIGYAEIFDFLRGPQTQRDYDNLVARIQQETRRYAKRQMTFWRMLYQRIALST